jgi:hypothetical protein
MRRDRVLLAGGVLGPAAFVSAWTIGSATSSIPYSVIDDPISRLAAVDAPTRPLMSAGFIVFGIGVPAFALALHTLVPGPAWIAAAGVGVTTLLVAATPLDRSELVDRLHGIAAGSGYVFLAAAPLLAAGPLRRRGHRLLAALGVAAGITSTICLPLSLSDPPTGLFQRIGLTAGDTWIAITAIAALSGRLNNTNRQVSP